MPTPAMPARPPKNAGAQAAQDSTFRASAVPRQAKTTPRQAPRSPTKKAPTARKDPLYDWCPPVPPSSATSGRDSRGSSQSTYSKDKFGGPADSSKNSSPRRGQGSTNSAFYHASPRSPFVNTPAHGRTASPATPDWSKKGSWSQSGTAYSTFHVPSSRYSPYAEDSRTTRPRDIPNPFFRSSFEFKDTKPFENSTSKETTEPSNPQHHRPCSVDEEKNSPETYDWQRSRSAYQRQTHGRPGSPEPLGTTRGPRRSRGDTMRKGTSPCYPSTRIDGPLLDSDIIDDLSNSEKENLDVPGSSRPRNNKVPPIVTDGSSSDSDESGSNTKSTVPNHWSDVPSKIDQTHGFKSSGRTGAYDAPRRSPYGSTAKFKTTFKASKPEESEEPARFRTEQSTSSVDPKRVSFAFNRVSIEPEGEAGSRRASGQVPYVHLNKIPDLDFSTPTSQSSSKDDFFAIFSEKKSVKESNTKKHTRLGVASGPRCNTAYESEKLADHFSEMGLNERSAAHKSPITNEPIVDQQTNPFAFSETVGTTAFTFSSPAASASSSLRTALDGDKKAGPPIIPHELLNHGPIRAPGREEYIKTFQIKTNQYQAYRTAWELYQSSVNLSGTNMDPAYLCAFQKHVEVTAAHHEMDLNFLQYVQSWSETPMRI